jgi:flagella basal body P-ring formation protein FlgA
LIREEVEEYFRNSYPEFELKVQDLVLPQVIILPKGNLRIEVATDQRPANLDGTSLKIDFHVDSVRQKSQWVRIRATARGRVPVLTKDKRYGELISKSDLDYEYRDFHRIDGFILDPVKITGSVAKRNLRAGDLVYDRDIEQPLLVERGEVVTLVARSKTVRISTLAKARDAGAKGDLIEVENLSSRQLVTATVVGSKTVEVNIPEIRR